MIQRPIWRPGRSVKWGLMHRAQFQRYRIYSRAMTLDPAQRRPWHFPSLDLCRGKP